MIKENIAIKLNLSGQIETIIDNEGNLCSLVSITKKGYQIKEIKVKKL